MRVHAANREICLKIVYYGPGLSGKTTNLLQLHERCPRGQRGAMVQLDTESERTLFFDYFPLNVGNLGGYKVKVDFFTVPGQSFYHATRRAVLEGVDGIVFVADSNEDREGANVVARADLARNLELGGRSLETVPHVYQWNKRDARRALPIRVLEQMLNPEAAPSLEAKASSGVGVWETQNAVLKLVFENLRGTANLGKQHA
ncbi:MAG TPA: gliding-motility protein MglA [Myxococcota bacterium]|nr:gliding-motility protein MglA [Myxococcota bacterium]